MWNQRNLTPPPATSFKVKVTSQWKGKVSRMQKQLEDAKTTWSMHEKLLESEQCLLEKMIYKMSSQFRSEKSLRSMNQIKVSLKRLKEVDLSRQLAELTEAFMIDLNFYKETEVYLPSRQMLQYDLVRLLRTAALLSRICQLSYNMYRHARHPLEIGYLIPQNTMMISMAARIWVTCKSLRSYICDCYQAVFPLLTYLHKTAVPWVKREEEPPVCLLDWLKSQFNEDSSQEDSMIVTHSQMNLSGFDGKVEEDDDLDGDLDDGINEKMVEDIGEPIARKERKDEITDAPIARKDVITDAPIARKDRITDAPIARKDVITDAPIARKDRITDAPIARKDEITDAPIARKDEITVAPAVERDQPVAVEKKHLKLRKFLKKKLIKIKGIFSYLKQIETQDMLLVNNGMQIVVSKTLKKKSKKWLPACRKYVKEGGAPNFVMKMRKMMIRGVMKALEETMSGDDSNAFAPKMEEQSQALEQTMSDDGCNAFAPKMAETERSEYDEVTNKGVKLKKTLKKSKLKGLDNKIDRKDKVRKVPEKSENSGITNKGMKQKKKLKKAKIKGSDDKNLSIFKLEERSDIPGHDKLDRIRNLQEKLDGSGMSNKGVKQKKKLKKKELKGSDDIFKILESSDIQDHDNVDRIRKVQEKPENSGMLNKGVKQKKTLKKPKCKGLDGIKNKMLNTFEQGRYNREISNCSKKDSLKMVSKMSEKPLVKKKPVKVKKKLKKAKTKG